MILFNSLSYKKTPFQANNKYFEIPI